MTREEALKALEEYRTSIDALDLRLLDLLNQRTRVVECIGRVKRAARLPIYEPKREDQVFANVASCNGGPITTAGVRRIFERIIDEMRTIQRIRMENNRDGDS
jgi:chorismate mutase